MGLDMYLTKKVYIGANYEHNEVTGTIELFKANVRIPIDLRKVSYIEENAVYWRKANAIHRWFVENVQDGEDDCGSYSVSIENLKELLAAVNEVLEDNEQAEEVLPTGEGFFFGSTDYDEWYFNDLQYTKDELEKIVNDPANEDFGTSFSYQSSW